MSDEAGVVAGGEVASAAPATVDNSPLSVREAVAAYAERTKREEDTNSSGGAPAEAAATETKSAVEAGAAPSSEGPGETQGDDPADLPPIDRPRSWSKDDDDDWNALPRARQEKIAANERAREAEINRRINEAAEARKAAEAELAKATETSKALAAELPKLEAAAEKWFGDQYPEFKTYDDVVNMARQAEALSQTDPFTSQAMIARITAWREHQQQKAMELSAARDAAKRLEEQKQSEWKSFVQAESEAFENDVPEFKAKKAEYTEKAAQALLDLGFSKEELQKLASGEEKISIFDRRVQKLLFNQVKYSDLKAAPAKAIPNSVPQVQRPGVAQPKGAAADANIQALSQRLTNSGSIKDAFALHQAKKAAAQR